MAYPFEGVFEPELTAGLGVWYGGKIGMAVYDANGVTPKTIIAREDEFKVEVGLEFTGPGVGTMTGKWVLDLFLERLGVGPDIKLPVPSPEPVFKPIVPGTPAYKWERSFTAKNVPFEAGAYRLYAVVTAVMADEVTPIPMAAYCEGPILQFHEGVTP